MKHISRTSVLFLDILFFIMLFFIGVIIHSGASYIFEGYIWYFWVVILFLWCVSMYFTIKYVPTKIFLTTLSVFFMAFGVYIFLYTYIPYENIENSPLKFVSVSDDAQINEVDLDIIRNIDTIREEISQISNTSDRQKYVKNILRKLGQAEYEKGIYFTQSWVIREGFFLNKRQYLDYIKQEITQIISNTDLEDIQQPDTNIFTYYFKFLISRSYLYDGVWTELEHLKFVKNILVEELQKVDDSVRKE